MHGCLSCGDSVYGTRKGGAESVVENNRFYNGTGKLGDHDL